ncbi:F-box/kelch-repeat protein SKIP25-like [Helianthus annuus]|uniref:F-box/kelch-repeat protein SKIP25-like n=1 Tax=Helianthus annuus TaxID=4232 RepID=UPI001652E05E|nr:F-box/kelch-repeat protein SKIP25-like [Helianthus annuus]
MANQTRATTTPTAKHRKLSDDHHSLLPGLPDHIAQLCLSLISPSALYSVCRSWRRLIYTVTFPPFRSLYTLSLPTNSAVDGGQMVKLFSFDPISSKWITVKSPLLPPYLRHLSLRHPSFMSRNFSIQSVSVSGNLVLIAATAVHQSLPVPAFPHPLIFNPLSNTWSSCPPLSTPRRWCAAGALQDTVVVASGIGSHYTETVARSVEKWVVRKSESFDEKIQSLTHLKLENESFDEKIQSLNHLKLKSESLDENPDGYCEKIQSLNHSKLKTESLDETPYGNCEKIQSLNNLKQKSESLDENPYGKWEKMQSLKQSKLCREAIDAVGWKGKLCMVNVKGDYAKEGFVYNLDSDEWAEMPVGMLGGWRGPTAAMDEETMYVVDESRGVLRRYNEDGDKWSEVVVDERLKGAEYIAAGGGRVCVVGEKGVGIVVVDVVVEPPRLWVVETPPGHDVLGLHILPRMCSPELKSPVALLESK